MNAKSIELFKFPQTPHVPWSESISSDDNWLEDCSQFIGKEVVVSSKVDGENTTLYGATPESPQGASHARSRDSGHHPSRSWVKQLHAAIKHDIPAGWRLCGENLYAYHSIWYWNLPSYFLLFGIYDDRNRCLSWNETAQYADLLGLSTVPVLYRGVWDEEKVKRAWKGESVYPAYHITKPNYEDNLKSEYRKSGGEGYVIRTAESFTYADFKHHVAKYVRANHVLTSANWMVEPIIPNRMTS